MTDHCFTLNLHINNAYMKETTYCCFKTSDNVVERKELVVSLR